MLMQNFGATIKKHYGMSWYFLEWPIVVMSSSYVTDRLIWGDSEYRFDKPKDKSRK